METLAQGYDLIVPEHPGFGQSDETPWLENMHDLAYYYLDLLDHLQLPAVHLVGSSLGGWLAMEIAIRAPHRVKSMLLSAPAGVRVPNDPPGDIFLWTPEQMARNLFHNQDLAEKVLAIPLSEDDQNIRLKNRHTTALLAWEPRLHDPCLHKWLHRANMPVTILWGAQDKIMPLACGEKIKSHLPNARLQVIDQCGHLPQIERPGVFCAAVQHIAA
jgi:pimeloyl-ACP methyl ester carboxylesterase